MSSLQASTLLINPSCFRSSSNSKYSSSSLNRINCGTFNVPKPPRASLSIPKASTRNLVDHGLLKFTNTTLEKNVCDTIKILHHDDDDDLYNSTPYSKATIQLYAILEGIADRIEMHNNMKEQRDNWNTLLLNSINMMTLTATTMAGVATATSEPVSALKLSSALLFSAVTGLLLVMNKIQPSQLAEEQRNATRLFKNLRNQIQTAIALGNNNNPSEDEVRVAMEKVLELDKAYPLPLLGAMLEKFPSKFKPARWWPYNKEKPQDKEVMKIIEDKDNNNENGWSVELEREMREVVEVVKGKDMEDYERLGNLALKINKGLAITGPLLTGIAALGSVAFLGDNGDGTSWGGVVPVVAGALAAVVNAFEHGGQVGMVFEMYRNCGGFFKLLEETIEDTIEERDLERREDGEVFEMKVALKLGRSVSQLRDLASKSASYRMEGTELDEFASKLF